MQLEWGVCMFVCVCIIIGGDVETKGVLGGGVGGGWEAEEEAWRGWGVEIKMIDDCFLSWTVI